jgi:hypothetical protein
MCREHGHTDYAVFLAAVESIHFLERGLKYNKVNLALFIVVELHHKHEYKSYRISDFRCGEV